MDEVIGKLRTIWTDQHRECHVKLSLLLSPWGQAIGGGGLKQLPGSVIVHVVGLSDSNSPGAHSKSLYSGAGLADI